MKAQYLKVNWTKHSFLCLLILYHGVCFVTCLFIKLLTLFQLQALLVVSEAELIALIYLFPLDFTMNLLSLMRLKLLKYLYSSQTMVPKPD